MKMNKIGEFLKGTGSLPGTFWLLNIFQMLERLAFWSLVMQLTVYIAQKDVAGGLHWGQDVKGWIFMWWALVQNLSPILAGGFADRYGYKKTLFVAFVITLGSYILLGNTRDLIPFFIGVLALGLGSGIFKPALQGALARKLRPENESLAWSIYFLLMNLAVFISALVSKTLKDISWDAVFWGSTFIYAINFLVLFFVPRIKNNTKEAFQPFKIIKTSLKNLFRSDLIVFITVMSGFMLVYMQFYETLPHFIIDWTDSSSLIKDLGLSDKFIMSTNRGDMLSYEWVYSLNFIVVTIGILFTSWMFSRTGKIKALAIGVLIATVGLAFCGGTMSGYILVFGVIFYTVGEMTVNPKFTEYLAARAGDNQKSIYLSYLNLSFAIGLAGGSVSGAYLYEIMAEKASLAARYLKDELNHSIADLDLSQTFDKLCEVTNLTPAEATNLLWDKYDPYMIWAPFILVGLMSVAGLFIYRKKYFTKSEHIR